MKNEKLTHASAYSSTLDWVATYPERWLDAKDNERMRKLENIFSKGNDNNYIDDNNNNRGGAYI